MIPCDFWAFPKVKNALKNVHWRVIEEIDRVTTQALKALTQEEFKDCFQQWEEHWSRCVSMVGNYFEGDIVPDSGLSSFSKINNSFPKIKCHGCKSTLSYLGIGYYFAFSKF